MKRVENKSEDYCKGFSSMTIIFYTDLLFPQGCRKIEEYYLVMEKYSFETSVHVTEVADWLVRHNAQVVHGTAEGNLDSFTNA